MNNNKKTIGIAAIALILGLVLGGFFFSSETEAAPQTGSTENSVETWTCSMHPQIRQGEPGECPICGMDLIPVKTSSSDGDPREIKMSPTAMQLAEVRTSIVGSSTPSREIVLNGKVQPDERQVTSQSSHIAGRIEDLMIDFTGERVRAGQVIARIYSPDLVTTQQELLEAQKMSALQPGLLEAAKQKLRNWKFSDGQIDEILAKGVPQETFAIHADKSGIVLKKRVNKGDYVQRGQSLFEIADLSRLWLLFDLHEKDMTWVKVGDEVKVEVPSMPAFTMNAKLDYVDPVIDPKSRVAKARVSIRNTNESLKPEMFIKGLISSPVTETGQLSIPKSAVMWTGERSIVYVRQPSESGMGFLLREIMIGADLGDSYVVTDGLEAGEEIVTNGTFSVDAAAQLAGKPSMMNPEGGKVMTGHDHGGTSPGSAASMDEMEEIQTQEIDGEARKAVDEIFTKYFDLKNALVGDDFSDAVQSATAMQESIAAVDMKVFKGDAHVQWMSREKELSKSLEHVAHYGDIDALRDGFIGISNAIISTAQTFGTSDTSYVDYCPMAADNTGASWLSEQEKILNPYFGAKMLKCGSITNTIK